MALGHNIFDILLQILLRCSSFRLPLLWQHLIFWFNINSSYGYILGGSRRVRGRVMSYVFVMFSSERQMIFMWMLYFIVMCTVFSSLCSRVTGKLGGRANYTGQMYCLPAVRVYNLDCFLSSNWYKTRQPQRKYQPGS